jgi:hypothetical protein
LELQAQNLKRQNDQLSFEKKTGELETDLKDAQYQLTIQQSKEFR